MMNIIVTIIMIYLLQVILLKEALMTPILVVQLNLHHFAVKPHLCHYTWQQKAMRQHKRQVIIPKFSCEVFENGY